MGIKVPFYQVFLDGQLLSGITAVRIHDGAGVKTDSLEFDITGLTSEPNIDKKKCKATIGYIGGDQATFGDYDLNGLRFNEGTRTYTIIGHAVDYSNKAKAKRSRTLTDITLSDLVGKLAGEMSLKPRVADEYKSIEFKAITQTNETNLNFILRIAKDHGALAKAGDGHLIFIERGKGKSASGKSLPEIVIYASDRLENFGYDYVGRKKFKSARASYYDAPKAAQKDVKVGSGEPQLSLRNIYKNKAAAQAAAKAELNNKKRETYTCSGDIEGNPNLIAESPIITAGLNTRAGNAWIVKSVDHSVDDNGFITSLEAETRVES